jgi:phosphate transport system substrate-binding protein
MKRIHGFYFIVLCFCLFAQTVQADVTYTGSTTVGIGIIQEASKVFSQKTGIRFDAIEMPGSGKGIEAVIAGKALMAGASRPLTPEEKKLKLYYQVIGYDAIGVFVHKSNPVKKLTKEQVKGIFTGRITNWKTVGGKDAPIVCITEILAGKHATIIEFQSLAMDGADYVSNRVEVDNPAVQAARLATEENGITAVSFSFAGPQLKVVYVNNAAPDPVNVRSGAYPLSRPLLLVTKGLPQGDVKKFIDFILSPQGQAIVAKMFIPITESK